ncbi:S1 family peptidase [Myxococcota bacterium]|nr:S1 family peptidase [Myxococcota bacterium]
MAAIREADLGIERVYVDEGHFYYALPADLDTPAEVTEGALTWAYDGQELFAEEREEPLASETIVPDLVLTGMDPDPEVYFGVGSAERLDVYGRRWVLVHVDYDKAQELREEDDREVEALFGAEEGERAVAAWETPPDAGVARTLEPMTYSSWRCWYGSDYLTARLDLDGAELDPVDAPLDGTGRKVLHLATGSCTGTMVDDEWMLTAAHCVNEPARYQVWCTHENLDENTSGSGAAQCSTWVERAADPDWDWDLGEPDHADYAVVRLITPPTAVGWMPITALADSGYEGLDDHIRGYPRTNYDCTSTQISDDSLTTVDTFSRLPPYGWVDLYGKHQHHAVGAVDELSSNMAYFTTSAGRGTSGGPHYYCVGTHCTSQYLTAVHAYGIREEWCTGFSSPYSCLVGGSAGPKGAANRDWVILNTP